MLSKSNIGITIILLWMSIPVYAQIRFMPTNVIISDGDRIGKVQVENPSDKPVEIDLSVEYVFDDVKGTDNIQSTGTSQTNTNDLTPYLKIFPKKFVLEPRGTQEVRIIAKAPDVAGRMLWTRLVGTSNERLPVKAEAQSGIRTGISFVLRQLIPVYLIGNGATTGIELGSARVNEKEESIELLIPTRRIGSSPFLGTATLEVTDASGRRVASLTRSASVHYSANQRFVLERKDLPTGAYAATVNFSSVRSSVRSGILPTMPPVESRFSFSVQ